MPQSSAQPSTEPDASRAGSGAAPWGRRIALPALVAITLLGGVLRLLRMSDFWLSADEAIYYFATLGDWAGARELIAVNAHPPLYYWLLFGLAKVDGSIAALRLTSLVTGVLCMPAMYLLVRSWGGVRAALTATFLLAISPGALSLSQVMRPYSMQLLFLILGLAGLARYLSTSRARWLVLHAFAFVVAVYLHYSSFIVLAGVATCLIGLLLLGRLDLGRLWRLALAELPILAGVVWLYLSHIRPTLMGGELQSNVRETWLSPGFLDSPLQLPGTLVELATYLFGRPADAVAFVALPLGLIVCARRRQWPLLLLFLGTAAAALLLSFTAQYPLLGRRHCLYLLALSAPLAGVALEELFESPRRNARVVGAVLGLLILASVVRMPRILARKTSGADFAAESRAVAQVRQQLDSEELVGAVILTDAATGVQLSCLYRESEQEYVPLEGGPVHSLHAGSHDFYCLRGAYRLVAEPSRRGEEGHLETLLDGLERLAETGRIDPLAERVWIVQSGYGQQAQRVLPLTLDDGTFLRSQRIGAFSIAIIEVDRAAYRRYLAESE